jgi:hypothetical protein
VKRLIVRALVVVALAVTGVVATQVPAQAAWTDCTTNPDKLCYYQGYNGANPMYYHTTFGSGCVDIGSPYDNTISSIKNNTGNTFFFYVLDNCATFPNGNPPPINGIKIIPYSQKNLGGISGVDNALSSFKRLCVGYC